MILQWDILTDGQKFLHKKNQIESDCIKNKTKPVMVTNRAFSMGIKQELSVRNNKLRGLAQAQQESEVLLFVF